MLERMNKLERLYTVNIGALGARWGLQTEAAFREGIAKILKLYVPDVQVERVVLKDESGWVFGTPDQVELDLIIRNGELLIGEIKSAVEPSDVYVFYRKAQFYQQQTGRQARKLVMISPMVFPRAKEVAERLGVELYTAPDESIFQQKPSQSTS